MLLEASSISACLAGRVEVAGRRTPIIWIKKNGKKVRPVVQVGLYFKENNFMGLKMLDNMYLIVNIGQYVLKSENKRVCHKTL